MGPDRRRTGSEGIIAYRVGEAFEWEYGGKLLAVSPIRDLLDDSVSVAQVLDRMPDDLADWCW